MITFKPAIKAKEINKSGKCNIKIRISHARKVRYIPTKYYIEPIYFDNDKGTILNKHKNATFLNIELKKIVLEYETKVNNFNASTDINLIKRFLTEPEKTGGNFFEFVQEKIIKLNALGKQSSSDLLKYMLSSLDKFTDVKVLTFDMINYKFLVDYETHLILNGLKVNAISVYLRNIRTIFNNAIDEGIIGLELYPFRRFKIKSERTPKRNLTINKLKLIKNTPLDGMEAYARDVFILSFYLIGINMIDLFNLDTLIDGRIEYRRAKTGRLYSIKVLPDAMKIIKRYPGIGYLLNFHEVYANAYNFKKAMNKFMKRIAEQLELKENVTSYYARHTWATLASQINIPIETISAALGHEYGNETTGIYIDFNMKKVDKANEMVCKLLTIR